MLEFLQYNYQENIVFYYYILSFVFILGLIFGSFINVVGLRLLSGESIVLPPSKCPKCGTKLKWYDNIPVLAYLMLKGRCRYCKTTISWQYPLVELTTAILFLSIFFKFEFTAATPMLWILACASVAMCITDFREQVIFDAVSIPLIPLGLVYSFFNLGEIPSDTFSLLGFELNEVFISSVAGIAIGFLFFEIISLFTRLLIKQRAFGEGDTIIAMIFGAFFGWKAVLATIVISFLVQAVITIPLMLSKIIKLRDKIATSSFLSLITATAIPLALKNSSFFAIPWVVYLFSTFVLIMAFFSAIVFLKRMKELDAFTLLPFGPALICAGFLVLFFEKLQIL